MQPTHTPEDQYADTESKDAAKVSNKEKRLG